jgi:N-acetylglucosamine kinase-like BadF-type ATPase
MQGVVQQALQAAKLSPADIAGAGFGIAGYDWDEDTPMIHEVIRSLGFTAPFEAMNDAGPGLLAGARHGWGVSVSSGTGVNARGRGPNGESARMTGNGTLFAEIGGGIELAYHVIGLISRAWSLRAPQTVLSERIVAFSGASSVEDLLAGIARGRYQIRASSAPLVFEAAAQGDAIAQEAVDWLGRGLGDLACGIIRQLQIEQMTFDVVLAGSIFRSGDRLIECMREVVHPLAPGATFVRLQAPPVSGTVMLAMQSAGVDFLPIRQHIIEGVEAIFVPQTAGGDLDE